jgi:hypothetical protein
MKENHHSSMDFREVDMYNCTWVVWTEMKEITRAKAVSGGKCWVQRREVEELHALWVLLFQEGGDKFIPWDRISVQNMNWLKESGDSFGQSCGNDQGRETVTKWKSKQKQFKETREIPSFNSQLCQSTTRAT